MDRRQSLHLKLAGIVVVLVVFVLAPYFLWHEEMDAYFMSPEFAGWLRSARSYAWIVAIALLVGDLFLPIPTSPIVATAGVIYGTFWGGVVGAAGSFLAGMFAYWLARLVGSKGARLIANQREMGDLQQFFDTWGVGGIIASRAMPVVPEVLTFMAGLARMHQGRFYAALLVGSIPMGFLLAWAGEAAGASSGLLLVLTLIPACLWFVYLTWTHRIPSKRRQVAARTARVKPTPGKGNGRR